MRPVTLSLSKGERFGRSRRYRGIAKNENCVNVLFALSNLFMSKKTFLAAEAARQSTPNHPSALVRTSGGEDDDFRVCSLRGY
jgi:hypothetical protein